MITLRGTKRIQLSLPRIVLLIIVLTASGGCGERLDRDMSNPPVAPGLSLCLRQYGIDNYTITTDISLKRCILKVIDSARTPNTHLINELARMGFICRDEMRFSCILRSRQRLYGISLDKFIEFLSTVEMSGKNSSIDRLSIEQTTIGPDGRQYGPVKTNNQLP